jgi:tol-pal system protein YbgF
MGKSRIMNKKNLLLDIFLTFCAVSYFIHFYDVKDQINRAKSGNAIAQSSLGYRYENGDVVEKNLNEAAKWFLLATKNGNDDKNSLVRLYEKGERSDDLVNWLQKSPSASFEIAKMFSKGNGIEINQNEADRWFLLAMNNGNSSSDLKDQILRIFKNGVRISEIVSWLKIDMVTCYEVGKIYEDEKNTTEAVKWYKLVMDKDKANANPSPSFFSSKSWYQLAETKIEQLSQQPKNSDTYESIYDSKTQYLQAYDDFRNGQIDNAIAQFNTLLIKDPNGTYANNAQYWLGEAYRTNNNIDAARIAFNLVIENYPTSAKVPDALLRLGIIDIAQGNSLKAKEYLVRLITDFPSSDSAQLAAKKLEQLDVDVPKTVYEPTKNQKTTSGNDSPIMKIIDYSTNNGGLNNELEIQKLKSEIELIPRKNSINKKEARKINNKGLLALSNSDYDGAVQLFLDANKLDEADAEVLANLGLAYTKQNKLDIAEKSFENALLIYPGMSNAWFHLGNVFALKNDESKAIACYANTYRYSKSKLNTQQFMKKTNANEKISVLKIIREKAINWAEINFSELGGNQVSQTNITAPFAPSFDCNKATKPSEITICSNPELADLDVKNSNLYKEAKNINPDLSKIILNESIKSKYNCGIDTNCLISLYNKSIFDYKSIISGKI